MARRTPVHAELIHRLDHDGIEEGQIEGEDDGQEFDADEAAAFEKFAREMRSSDHYAKINVYEQPSSVDGRPNSRKLTWLFEVGLDQLEFSQLMGKIRDEYGTGIYRLQGRDPSGAILFNRAFAIKAPERKPEKPGEPAGFDILASFNKAMAEQQARTEALLMRVVGANKQNEAGNLQGMQQFAVMLSMFKEIAGVFSGGGVATKPVSVLDELRKLSEVRDALKGLAGDGDGGDGGEKNIHDTISSAVQTFGPLLVTALTQQQAAAHGPRRLARPAPKGPVTIDTPTTDASGIEQPPPHGDATQMQFSKQISILVMNAAAGVDPVTMADSILDMTPDESLEKLREFVESPDAMAQMIAANPGVAKHLPWFQRLHAELSDYFKGEYLQDSENPSILSPSDVPASPDAGNVNEGHS